MENENSKLTPLGDRLMVLQGLTRAFFMWVLKTEDEDYIYEVFVDLMQEYKFADIKQQLFFVMLQMGRSEGWVADEDVKNLFSTVEKKDTSLYQWLIQYK
jgi:hypothetical protein